MKEAPAAVAAETAPPSAVDPAPAARRKAPLPAPRNADPERLRVAAGLLAELRCHDPRLLLAEADVRRLAPAVAAWLERNADPVAVRRGLTHGLPGKMAYPAGILAHRLAELIPPPLPDRPAPDRPHPFHTCEGCDRAFRAPEPGRCRDCRPPSP
ncbi:hypothetical protein [Streptomyces sp. CC228A]|uniref:hypothetical protein n=1 Tax=Streptomyces sp. CC228A TaxID=2898186 RepID=UPI001F430D7D|nr:hypothetical protein [Streptomyces sp. CC228A]